LLPRAAPKPFGLQLADRTAALFVRWLRDRQTPHGSGVSTRPRAGLLPQCQQVTSQLGPFGAQLIQFRHDPDE
jgi:hypothetical protein